MNDIFNHTLIRKIRGQMRVTRLVCSRTIKGQGDTYLGMASDTPTEGLTLQESLVASALLSMHVDLLAYQQASAGGVLTTQQRDAAVAALQANYAHLLASFVQDRKDESDV